MTERGAQRAGVVRRSDYRLERALGGTWRREPGIALDLTAVMPLSGTCVATLGPARLELGPTELLLVNPGTTFGLEGTGDSTPYVHLALEMRPATVDRAAEAAGLDRHAVVLFPEGRAGLTVAVGLTARRIDAEFDAARTERLGIFDLAAALLAVDLVRTYARPDRSSRVERSRAGPVDRRLRRAVEFMHDNFDRELGVGEIAAAAYMSEFHFARLFKRVTGQTPYGYVGSLRIAAAERLLADRDLSVAEVGARVGYQSASHFAKVFREATGMTPTAFRDLLVD